MSDEIKKTVLNTLAEPIANSAKNITDKPTQNMGTTLADIWYLVFGGISQAADKKKLKYSYALKKMESELKESISKIPKNKLIDPDIQIVAQALEAAKYCVEKEELRHMFVKLISNSLNTDTSNKVHPIYINIINNLTPLDAKVLIMLNQHNLTVYFEYDDIPKIELIFDEIITSICVLENLGLVYFNQNFEQLKSSPELFQRINGETYITDNFNGLKNLKTNHKDDHMKKVFSTIDSIFSSEIMESIIFTKLGLHFIESCL